MHPRNATSRRGAALAAGLLTVTLLVAGAPRASAIPSFAFTRLAGANRYETAAAIARADHPNGALTVLVARDALDGTDADALASNYLAGLRAAPILLTQAAALPHETVAALNSLRPQNIVVVGGTTAVSAHVEDQLRARPNTVVTRVAGANRYDTAARVARIQAVTLGGPGGQSVAFLARSEPRPNPAEDTSPDALAAGPASFAGGIPILLTALATTPAETLAALRELQIRQVVILGGNQAVSDAQESSLRAAGFTTTRLAGANRAETSVAVAGYEYSALGFARSHVNVARGDASADALTGGAHGGRERAPVLVTTDACVTDASLVAFLRANASTLATGHVFGGPAAVCEATESALRQAAAGAPSDGGGPGTPPPGGGGGTTGPPPPALNATFPELVTATVRSTSPAGTSVLFEFDEPVTPTATGARFHVLTATGFRFDGSAAITAPDPADPAAVAVLFPGATTDTGLAAHLTVATVDAGAVVDDHGVGNSEGDAPLGAAGTIALQAGVTAAPDLRSASVVATATIPGEDPGEQFVAAVVDFVFDQPAFLGTVLEESFGLVSPFGDLSECTPRDADGATTAITADCLPFEGDAPTTPPTAFARAFVAAGAVAADPEFVLTNPLQVADAPRDPTSGPDLAGVQLRPSPTPGGTDQVVFEFDEPVGLLPREPGAGFFVYDLLGRQFAGTTAVVSSVTPTQVTVAFGDVFPGGTAVELAVGAAVGPETVTGATSLLENQPDELAVPNGTTVPVVPGRTAAPDLVDATLEVARDGAGTVTGVSALFTFDEPLARLADVGRLRLFTPTRAAALRCSAATVVAAAPGSGAVRCTQFEAGGVPLAELAGAVIAGVDDAAVVPADLGPANPEGAVRLVAGSA